MAVMISWSQAYQKGKHELFSHKTNMDLFSDVWFLLLTRLLSVCLFGKNLMFNMIL